MITGLLLGVLLAQTQTYPYVSATVTVTVTDETGAPIPERAVTMYYSLPAFDPNTTGRITAVTDASGVATLAGNLFTGTWRLRVNGGSQFDNALTEVVISPDQHSYQQAITLHRRRGGRFSEQRSIVIDVFGVAPDGSRVPIAGATVSDASGNTAVTGSGGRATMTHNGVIGDLRAFTATPPDGAMWKPNSNTAVIGRGAGNTTGVSDYLLIELQPGPAYHAPNGNTEKTLTISVLDHDTDQPVSGAVVNLIGTAGQTLTTGTTAAQGELYFARLNGYTDALRVQVLANGYRGALQNVPAELFDNGNAVYTVYLYKAAVWQGRWVGTDTTFTIGPTDMSGVFFITYERTVQNLNETGTFGCRVDPSQYGTASCNWQGRGVYHYDSGDVTGNTSGTATLIMQGDNTITMTITRTNPNPATYSFSITRSP
ncbi:MAG TPA: hypothetical protein VFO29_10200 [Candidatus Rubrimentiphilum sp.]|nr:hypothetical protein [Candidatus Rubrimentiphilum sp.]